MVVMSKSLIVKNLFYFICLVQVNLNYLRIEHGGLDVKRHSFFKEL